MANIQGLDIVILHIVVMSAMLWIKYHRFLLSPVVVSES